MKLLVQSAMIFFGTLMAAAVVALGEPAKADIALAESAKAATSGAPGLRTSEARGQRGRAEFATHKQGLQLR